MYAKTRSSFTPDDCRFIAETLGIAGTGGMREFSALLRDDRLFQRSITPPPVFLTISPQLFFFVFAGRALGRTGIASDNVIDDVADYVADVCVEFRRSEPVWQLSDRGGFFYVADLLGLMDDLDARHRHLLRRHIGNVTLFLTGFFAEHFESRTARSGAPAIDYYEEVASEQFGMAASDRCAEDDEAAPVLEVLADRFTEIRSSLGRTAAELAGGFKSLRGGTPGSTGLLS